MPSTLTVRSNVKVWANEYGSGSPATQFSGGSGVPGQAWYFRVSFTMGASTCTSAWAGGPTRAPSLAVTRQVITSQKSVRSAGKVHWPARSGCRLPFSSQVTS